MNSKSQTALNDNKSNDEVLLGAREARENFDSLIVWIMKILNFSERIVKEIDHNRSITPSKTHLTPSLQKSVA